MSWSDAYDQATAEHAAAWRCDHPTTELRRKVNRAGATTYVHQCLTCGDHKRAVKSATLNHEQKAGAPPVDRALWSSWCAEKNADRANRARNARVRDARAFWAWYDDYLRSPDWRRRRALVIDRAHGRCEGCASAPATQVHHLSYDRVGNEMLFDLVALCSTCHDRVHNEAAA